MLKRAALIFFACLCPGLAVAQAWPDRPVRWIHTSPPGSSADIIARVLSDPLGARWGRQIVIENRPGAAGNIAAQAAARSAPDGYNYFFAVASTLAINPYTMKTVPFDAERDFVGVANIGVSPFMIAVHPALPVKSVAELIAHAKRNPGKLAFATSGTRNLPHITGELFKRSAGIDMLNVPYKGSPQAVQSLIAGDTQLYFDSVPALAQHIGGGRVRVIGVTAERRLPGFDSIAAVAETLPGFTAVGWFALVAPTSTPADVVARVNRDINAVLAQPEVASRMRELGVFEGGGSPAEVDAFMRAERGRWQKVVREAGIEPE
jgi:tripartite-type tricarboxylate transporter receptor subunit TctC